MLNVKLRIMKKKNLLKFLFTAIAVFVVTGVFAQNVPYAEMTDNSGTATTDMVTVSNTIVKYLPYYVEPDDVLNSLDSDYDPTLGGGTGSLVDQGINSTFEWTFLNSDDSENDGSAYSFRYLPTSSPEDQAPYVEVSFDQVGQYKLSVLETSQGGCPGGSSVVSPVQVIAEPSFQVTSDGNDVTYERCALTNEPIQVYRIPSNGVSGGDLYFEVDFSVDNIDINTDPATVTEVTATTTRHISISEDGNMGTDAPVTVVSEGLPVEGNAITRYTYTFKGINDHISRKTDFLAMGLSGTTPSPEDFNFYNPDGGSEVTITYMIYPAPNTGDIYYVPNDYNL